jgi:transcriptional regulator with GAF, ATPase, and Fis domain
METRASAWVQPALDDAELGARGVAGALARAGIEVEPRRPDRAAVAGLVFLGAAGAAPLEALRRLSDGGRVRVLAVDLCAEPDPAAAWALLEAGASDVIAWGEDGAAAAAAIAERLERWRAVDALVASPQVRETLVGESGRWRATLRRLVEVARFTDAAVLILGESGTGKELAARLLHALDPRPQKGPLVVVDCATVVPELSGSEFFGHERGAYTGAAGPRDGAFALANGGTLFLDEVGELPAPLQAQLLRVVQERTYKRVGGSAWQETRFRLVSATNRDLAGAVREGRFRHDLYHRLASWTCTLPPLRQRSEDVLLLARHFMREGSGRVAAPALDRAVERLLLARSYPGNVRELRQLALRIMHRHVGAGPVTVGDVPEEERPAAGDGAGDWRGEPLERALRLALALGVRLKEIGRAAEEGAIELALRAEGGNLQRAARRLGVTDRALQLRRAAARGGSS